MLPNVLIECLDRSAERYPDRLCVHFGIHQVTYVELDRAVATCAASLAEMLRPATGLVGVRLGRTPEYVVAYLAIAALGCAVVPFDEETPDHAVEAELEELGVDLLVAHRAPAGFRGQSVVVPRTDPGSGTIAWSTPGTTPAEFSVAAIRPDTPLILLKTSGSTARPKRVVLSHRNVLASSRSHRRSVGHTTGGVSLVVLPMSYGYCNTTQIVNQIDAAGGVALLPRGVFLPRTFADAVHDAGATTTTVVPSMLTLLARSPQDPARMRSLRSIVFGGAPVPPETLAAIRRQLPDVELIQTYGQTEAGPRVTTLRAADADRRHGSVGRAIPGVRLEIRSPDGRRLPPGRTGEVVVQGPGVMAGYHNDIAATAKVLRSGWLHTGDLGRIDDDGFLWLSGRLRNLIITAGYNIVAEEIEDCLRLAPGVVDAAVFGDRDELRGEVVHAMVVPDRNAQLSAEGIRWFVGQRLADYKIPRRITFAASLPRTANGKLRREGLAALARGTVR